MVWGERYVTNWHKIPKQKSAEHTRDISADNFNLEGKKELRVFIREVIQNTLDARAEDREGTLKQAIIKFKVLKEGEGGKLKLGTLASYSNGLEDALSASGLGPQHRTDPMRQGALIFEESNTTGLIGVTDDSDYEEEENKNDKHQCWNNFWHRTGSENKGLKALGRRGQGKITYHLASGSATVFALTNQERGTQNLLMGKSRFPKSYKLDEKAYLGYAFFAKMTGDNDLDREPIPFGSDDKLVTKIKDDFDLLRDEGSGTSWVIPYINLKTFKKEEIIKAIISEFYLAFIQDDLWVSVEGQTVCEENLMELIDQYHPFENLQNEVFIKWIINQEENLRREPSNVMRVKNDWFVDSSEPANSESFLPGDLDALRQKFNDQDSVSLLLPIILEPKGSDKVESELLIHVKAQEEGKTQEVFARDCLIVEDEKHVRHFPGSYYAAVLAKDDRLVAFLGDCDDPSHSKWNVRRNQVTDNYKNSQKTIRQVRQGVNVILRLVTSKEQEVYEDLFSDLISIPTATKSTKKNKRRRKRDVIKPVTPRKPKKYSQYKITHDVNVCSISASERFDTILPATIMVKFAYATFDASDAFKAYHLFDFDLNKLSSSKIKEKSCEVLSKDANWIEVQVTKRDFVLKVSGFDPHELEVEIT